MSQKFTQDNKKNKEQYSTYKAVIIAIIIAIASIAIVNIVCILAMCYPDWFKIEVTKNLSDGDIVEATILSDGIAIIGLAVAVWTGLNIVNSIEKREVDKLQNRVNELNEEIKERRSQQNQVDKDKFLHEMYATAKDEATAELTKMFRKSNIESDVSFLELLDIEQKFRSVYELHQSEFKQDENLSKVAEEGISFAGEIFKHAKDSIVKLYLDFRIAEFHFYMGYCCLGKERLEHFTIAINKYIEVADDFNADIPEYVADEVYPSINYLQCKKIPVISAYFCNTIGEAYSKIEQEKKQLKEEEVSDDELKTYGLKAIFYCAYANYWRTKSVYKRNLGCAIERMYGALSNYEKLEEEYRAALSLDCKNINNFKTMVSLYDKYVNNVLHIEKIAPSEKRKEQLCSKEFAYIVKNLCTDSEKTLSDVLTTLKNIHTISRQAKAIHPSESVGYQYDCIYYRDMCAIYGNHTLETDEIKIDEMRKNAKLYYDKAEKNLEILEIMAPNNPMTKILKNDLDDLEKLL